MEWTDEKVLELIEMYRLRPILWDYNLPDYKNRNKRHDALKELATHFEVHKTEIEKKIRYLQTNLSRELKKENKSKSSGAGSAQVYISKWFCFNALMFLRDRNSPKNTVDTVDTEITQNEEQNSEIVDDPEPESALTNPTDASTAPSASTSKTKMFISPKKMVKRKKVAQNQSMEMASEALSIMKNISSKREEKDEYSVFGEQIAMKIRKLPLHRSRVLVQHKINNILFEAEMEMYQQRTSFDSHSSYRRDTFSSSTSSDPYTRVPTPSYWNAIPESPGYTASSPYASSTPSPLPLQISPPDLSPYVSPPSTHHSQNRTPDCSPTINVECTPVKDHSSFNFQQFLPDSCN